MASAIPAASVRGARTSALEDRDVRELRYHAEGPQVADTEIEALMPILHDPCQPTTLSPHRFSGAMPLA
jgi:hypothetical protein